PGYDWQVHRATAYGWWIERFRRTFELVDAARIDVFRGFVSYVAVPAHHRTARRGEWRRGPGLEPFAALSAEFGELQLIAEDLGVITPAVYRSTNALGLAAPAVLRCAFRG